MSGDRWVQQLLVWYGERKRALPWRIDKDPYRIWVSEIMLQQTRVDTVIPYYERFIKRFPTLQHLSEATEDEVLKHWEGLGYYSRARNLHSAVKEVVAQYDGMVPQDEKEITKLKGIGPYTRGAILSIAFDQPIPAVDGNVLRVMSRLFAIEKDIAKASTRKEIETLVSKYIPSADPSGFNQGLMELGALICVPQNPKCSLCPVVESCIAKSKGIETSLPIKNVQEKKRDVELITVVYQDQKEVLLHQREENLLKGLWEFTSWEIETVGEMTAKQISELTYANYGLTAERFQYIGSVQHTFSHLRWKMKVYHSLIEGKSENFELDSTYRWVAIDDLDRYAFPVSHQKIRSLWLPK